MTEYRIQHAKLTFAPFDPLVPPSSLATMNTHRIYPKRKVLIIDDNEDAALTLSMCLSAYGHETEVAYSGLRGIEAALQFEPEVVLLDLGMPGMSGYRVAAAVRQLPGLAHVFIAALTGWNDQATRQMVVEAGFDKHLVKPANVEMMLDLITDVPGRIIGH